MTAPTAWFNHLAIDDMPIALAVTLPPNLVPAGGFRTVADVAAWAMTQTGEPGLAVMSLPGERRVAFQPRVAEALWDAGRRGVVATIFAPPDYWFHVAYGEVEALP